MHLADSRYARFAGAIHDHPGSTFSLFILLIALGIAAMFALKPLDVGMEGLLGEDAPENRRYEEFKKLFGSDEIILVLVRTDDVFAEQSLRRLKALHRAIEKELPQVDQVASLANTPYVMREGQRTVIGTALEPWPENPAALAQRLRTLQAHAPSHRALVNDRRDMTLLLVRLRPLVVTAHSAPVPINPGHYREITAALERIASAHRTSGFRIDITGQATALGALQGILVRDIYVLPLASLLASMLTLLLLFQRPSGVILPALVIVMPITTSFGLMALSGFPIQLPTALLPPFLVVMGVAGTVHLLTSFYRHFDDAADRRTALLRAFDDKGPALLMTSLTTAAGLASFAFAGISPIANLGIFGATGTLLALVSTLVVFPLYVRLVPMRPLPDRQREAGGVLRPAFATITRYCTSLACAHPGRIVLLALATLALASVIAANLRFAHDYLSWLPPEWPVFKSARIADAEFHSGVSVEILLDSGRQDGIAEPAFIRRLQLLQRSLRGMHHAATPVGMLVSVEDYLAQTRQTLDKGDLPYGDDADGRRRLQRDLRLLQLSAPALLRAVASQDLRYARISVRTALVDGAAYDDLLADIRQRTRAAISDSYPVTITGQVPITHRTLNALSSSATQSYLLSTGIILVMMILFLRSTREGLWSLLPNLLPVIVVLAGMYLFGVNLDIFSMLVVSIALGLVVDDTIHVTMHFKRNFRRCGDPRQAARDALEETGGAMIISTLVLVLGVQLLHLSELGAIGTFSMLTSAIMLLGLAADFVIAPAIMIWLYSRPERSTA